MSSRLDVWIGNAVFAPFVLLLCRMTRQTPSAVSRLFWFIAALAALYRAENIMTAILFGGMSIYMMTAASLRADRPTRSHMKFRLLALALLLLFVIRGVATGQWAGTEFWILVSAAQYASTIRADTIAQQAGH